MKNVCVRCLRLSLKFVCLLACLSLHENVLVGGPVWLTRKNVCSTGSLLIWVDMNVGVGLSSKFVCWWAFLGWRDSLLVGL